ncbi:MAG: VIT domain-containing protein [Myxococcota bacterium]
MKAQSVVLALLAAVPGAALAHSEPDLDRVGAPYLRIKSDQPSADRVPLKETHTDVDVAGVIAHVKVTQTYENDGTRPLEAIYVFPGSTRAAVFAMRMTIGERTIVAKIQEKDAARRIYEQAKQEGKTASLLEQERPNVFQMNVGNILPGDKIKVELDYVELLVPSENIYELVVPTVVGPRYDGTPNQGKAEAWSANPYLQKGAPEPFKSGISAHIRAGMPIQAVTSPSHQVNPNYLSQDSVAVEVNGPDAGNRDFVLRYRLSGDRIDSGVLLFPGEEENFFLMTMQPPKHVEAASMPAREYIFILDVSGSMIGFPLNISKALMRELFRSLRPQDRFNVMTFSGGSAVFSEQSVAATPANIQRAMDLIDRQQGGGATEILPAMRRALSMPRTAGMSTSFVIATDGYVVVEKETFDTIAQNLGKANVFPFGIGSSVNRFIIEGMAHAGMGESYVVLKPDQAEDMATKLRRTIASPVLTDIAVRYDGFDAYDVEPISVPDLFAEKPVVVFGKYRGAPRGRITVTGHSGNGAFQQSLTVDESKLSKANVALQYLWARHKIMRLSDQAQLTQEAANKAEVIRLGLKYNLLTQFTSFVAVDEMVRNRGGAQDTVAVPLPLPAGVENSAVGRVSMAPMAAPPAGPMGSHGYGGLGTRSAGDVGGGKGLLGVMGGERYRSAEKDEEKAAKKVAPEPTAATEAKPDDLPAAQAASPKTKADEPAKKPAVVQVKVEAADAHAPALTAMVTMMAERVAKELGVRGRLSIEVSLDAQGKIVAVVVKPNSGWTAAQAQKLVDKLMGGLVRGDGLGGKSYAFTIQAQ